MNVGSYLQVELQDGTKVIGRVNNTEPIISIQVVGGFNIYHEIAFTVIREVPKSEVDFLLGEEGTLANESPAVR